LDALSGLRLYVDGRSPAAVQVAAWRASGDTADAAALERIATQPTARWFANGDPPQATAAALVAAASAGRSVAELVLYNIPGRDCHGYSSGGASNDRDYLAWVSQIAAGIGHHPAIVLLEPDAIDQAADGCLQQGEADSRYRLLSQAVAILKSNPSIHVYLDAGHPGWLPVGRIVGALRRAGVERADGFALNVANFKTTSASIAYGRRIARRLGGRHFVIDTSRNGNGPPTNASGIDRWCNPPGRALGHAPTTRTGDPLVDAFLWVKYPGASDGACRPGEPPAGTWWASYALGLARGGEGG
jgi:endoglucanase